MYRKVAEHELVEAQIFLANMYYDGIGVEKNLGEAYKWYIAAEQGRTDAQYQVPRSLYFGEGVEVNFCL